MTTTDQLAAIEARLKKTSAGPWQADDSGGIYMNGTGGQLMGQGSKRNAEFIAHARTDVPALLAMVREQRAALDKVADFIGWCDAASADGEAFYAVGKISARATADRLRAAITATEGA